ncbi:MAG: hypothetical protein E6J08_08445 [Chloroflexi bacterium]|nr:MAG: hypothetical protein E6J08_08445 [Chloroflexota bacterium]
MAGWYLFSAIYAAFLPFWMGGLMSQYVQQSVQRQQAAYPPGEGPPPGFTEMMTSIMSSTVWLSAVFALAIAIVAIIGAWKRWTWVYYAVIVLLGFGVLGLTYNVIDLISGGTLTSAQSLQVPQWARVVAVSSGVVGTALFVGMLVALVKRGPWGTKRIS